MPEFLVLPLSGAALAPPKATNLSHSSKVCCAGSAQQIGWLVGPSQQLLQLHGMEEHGKPGATKNISAASTPG